MRIALDAGFEPWQNNSDSNDDNAHSVFTLQQKKQRRPAQLTMAPAPENVKHFKLFLFRFLEFMGPAMNTLCVVLTNKKQLSFMGSSPLYNICVCTHMVKIVGTLNGHWET